MRLTSSLLLVLLLVLLMVAVALSLAIGPVPIPIRQVVAILGAHLFSPFTPLPIEAGHGQIVWELRVPRTLVALCVGAALAVAGAIMQGFFQNPMADPYIIGISAGGSLGATIALTLRIRAGVQAGLMGLTGLIAAHWPGVRPALEGLVGLIVLNTLPLMAFLGALGVTFLVYVLAHRGGRVPAGTLLLTGIAVGSLASAVTSFLLVFSPEGLHGVIFWLMGSLANREWADVWMIGPALLVGLALIALYARDLNVLLLGDEAAAQLGIEVEKVKRTLLVVAALLAAAAVSVSGLIGFVGLIIPHLVRLLVGPDHRRLIPFSALAGALLLLLADLLARSLASIEIPIGILTALLGCPFFLYLLYRRKEMVL